MKLLRLVPPLVALLSLAPAGAAPYLTDGMVKLRPGSSWPTPMSAYAAARNETESFQAIITGPMTGIVVTASSLIGASAAISADRVRLYRVGWIELDQPSNMDGEAGTWPDPLIPETDPWYQEDRGAFPFDLAAGERASVWADLFVPPGTPAGEYDGYLRVAADGGIQHDIPYRLTVWDFDLPSTSSQPSSFGYEGWDVLRGYYGPEDMHDHYDQIVPFTRMYLECGLAHRITLANFLKEDWDLYADPLDWEQFDERWGPYMDGIDLPRGLKGARVTAVELPDHGDTDPERVAYWQGFTQHFRSRGWFPLLYDYAFDEPGDDPEDYQAIRDRADLVHQADPDLRVLVTTDIQEAGPYAVEDAIDIWVPLVNFIHGRPYEECWHEEYEGNQRALYDPIVASGSELWFYQSCMSHGCTGDPDEDPCYRGWPSYMIDHGAVANRVMGWAAYFYDIRGELYFDVNYADGVGDAWTEPYQFGGNGDGTLIYPGRTEIIGGEHPIPVESIRLKLIRDGMEDLEYFRIYESLYSRAEAVEIARAVVVNAYQYNNFLPFFMAARRSLAEGIEAALQTPVELQLAMPSHQFSPGQACWLRASLTNPGNPRTEAPLFVLLEVAGQYWCWPSWRNLEQGLDYGFQAAPTGTTQASLIPEFPWPSGAGSMDGLRFLAALTDPTLGQLTSNIAEWNFGFQE